MHAIRKILVGLTFLFFNQTTLIWGAEPFRVVCDIDDTLKITNVASKLELIKNGITAGKVFLGMSEFLQALSTHAESIVYLSGSPQSIEGWLRDLLLEQNLFPFGNFFLRNWLNLERTAIFKARELERMARETGSNFLLIGDDTDLDSEIYSKFRNSHLVDFPDGRFESRVTASYIHRIHGRILPEDAIPFYTAFDLALHEVEAHRITPEQAMIVGQTILNAERPDLLFPSFKYCPVDFEYSHGPSEQHYLGSRAFSSPELVALSQAFKGYVRRVCSRSRL